MRSKDLLWPVICLVVFILIYQTTSASRLLALDIWTFAAAFCFYFLSIIFWVFAWVYLMRERLVPSLRLNLKALLGVSAPFGLGSDAIRTYLARAERIKPEKALSASFVVKFYKFLIMFLFLIAAVYVLAHQAVGLEVGLFFISMIAVTVGGAVLILLLRLPAFARLLHRLLNRIFIFRFHEQLNRHFIGIKPRNALVLLSLLLISSLLEMAAIMFAFRSIGQGLLLPHILIFSAVASSLANVTVTPQGIGFVEGGGYFVLSLGYFSLSRDVIGSFLIIWGLIRIWIPSLIGLLSFGWKR